MRQTLKRLANAFADSTSLLALATAILFIVLYAIIGDYLLLIAFLPYAIVGAIGVYVYQRNLNISPLESELEIETAVPATSTALPEETITMITTRLGVTADGLVRASNAINEVTQKQSTSAQEQASLLVRTNAMLDTFLELSEGINEQIRSVTQTAQEAADTSDSGQAAIEQSIRSMDDIRVQVDGIGRTLLKLAEHTRRIDEIITSVSEIATQSNLLALNASIEAARAGVHGRGFAVVADEVRVLAKQSTESAAQVREILGLIQQAMSATVEATQQGRNQVDIGLERTQEADTVMRQLVNSVKQSREAVADIYQVVRQQADGIEEIAINVDRVNRLTQQSVASTRTVETVSTNLTRLANDLHDTVSQSPALGGSHGFNPAESSRLKNS